jgi:peptide deformylase
MIPSDTWLLNDIDQKLRKKSADVILPINEKDQLLINRMVSYIDACYTKKAKEYKIREGIALAGPQVGLLKKVIYIHFDLNKIEHKYLIANPKIIAESITYGFIEQGEGCLSVPKEYEGVVKRRNRIVVEAYDLINKKNITIDAEGILAICLQHEIDHLSGILYYDRINKNQPLTIEPE